MNPVHPVVRDVVLLGGGHAHVIVIRMWAMRPIPGVRLSLISDQAMTPYSGMLPGLVAGHYSYEQSHIDLPRLCSWAGVRFIEAHASGVDAPGKQVLLPDRPPVQYDVLSIDTGGAPKLDIVSGAAQYATPVKPVSRFFQRWQLIEQRLRQNPALRIGVVGAGAGGFEILLAMRHYTADHGSCRGDKSPEFHWLIRGEVLEGTTRQVRKNALEECDRKGIERHHDFDVVEVKPDRLIARDGRKLDLDEILWCTEAQAPDWPRESGLHCNSDGFLLQNDCLQIIGFADIFAAGDIAVQRDHPRPRAGVFAVRQGPVLFENLQRYVLQRPLKKHRPQRQFLTLLSLGEKKALARRGIFSARGRWVWRWKDWIDQKFMDRFNDLPDMPPSGNTAGALPLVLAGELADSGGDNLMRCGGCGAKVSGDVLVDVLDSLRAGNNAAALSPQAGNDDVAVLRVEGDVLAQSVDQIRVMIDDPWLFARIATLHGLNDLYASAAKPSTAMLLLTLPFATSTIVRRELTVLIDGALKELNAAGCGLTGGHTSEGVELAMGLVVNGALSGGSVIDKSGLRPGQCLVLTKPVGGGMLLAAKMRGKLAASEEAGLMDMMLQSNAEASEIAVAHGVTAMTDISGFGLIGHLGEMLRRSEVDCELMVTKIPLLDGVERLGGIGIRSSLFRGNLTFGATCELRSSHPLRQDGDPLDVAASTWPVLFDPQTNGGLLFGINRSEVDRCIDRLQQCGYDRASVIACIPEAGPDASADTKRAARRPVITLHRD